MQPLYTLLLYSLGYSCWWKRNGVAANLLRGGNRNLQEELTACQRFGHTCGTKASCFLDQDGGHHCVCNDGWDTLKDPDNGFFLGCIDRDECILDKPCGKGAICVDHDPPQKYSCVCPNNGPMDENGDCIIPQYSKSAGSSPPSTAPSTSQTPSTWAPTITNGITYSTICPATDEEDVVISQTFDNDGSFALWSNARTFSMTNGNTFLGPYYQGDSNPSQTITIDAASVTRVGVSFDFYEIGSFDGSGRHGPDRLSVEVSDGDGGSSDIVDLGSFHYNSRDVGNNAGVSNNGGISWKMLHTAIDDSPQTGLFTSWRDQHHVVNLDIPRLYFASTGKLRIKILWSLSGKTDEAVGIDNFKVTRCIGIVNSMSPSSSPSEMTRTTTTTTTPAPTLASTPGPTPTPTLAPISGECVPSVPSDSLCGDANAGQGCLLTVNIQSTTAFVSNLIVFDSCGQIKESTSSLFGFASLSLSSDSVSGGDVIGHSLRPFRSSGDVVSFTYSVTSRGVGGMILDNRSPSPFTPTPGWNNLTNVYTVP